MIPAGLGHLRIANESHAETASANPEEVAEHMKPAGDMLGIDSEIPVKAKETVSKAQSFVQVDLSSSRGSRHSITKPWRSLALFLLACNPAAALSFPRSHLLALKAGSATSHLRYCAPVTNRHPKRIAMTLKDDVENIESQHLEDSGPPPSDTYLAIEATFFQAAGGMSGSNYELSLMEFIRSVRDAYDKGITVPVLNSELAMSQQYTGRRVIQPDEIDLRTIWLSLVYLTFEWAGYQSKDAKTFPATSVARELQEKFDMFTYEIANAKKQGYTLDELNFYKEERAPTEILGIHGQAMRICYLAIQAGEEV